MQSRTRPDPRTRKEGFTIVEMVISITIVVIGLASVAAGLLSVTRQREQASTRLSVLSQAQVIMEEIKGANPGTIVGTYDGATFPVDEVIGPVDPDVVITVSVDDTDPNLLVIDLAASWLVLGAQETMDITTNIFVP